LVFDWGITRNHRVFNMTLQGWLDIHAHFFLPSSPQDAEALADKLREGCFMVSEPVTWQAETVLDYNDRAGIQLQMLSYIPPDLRKLQDATDYGASLVTKYPTRFGLLAGLPTNDPEACLREIARTSMFAISPDGFAVTTEYNGVGLGDARLEPVWTALNGIRAVVHVHPNAYAGPTNGRPSPLIEVAFDTARTVVDMLYAGVFRRHPDIKFVLGHCGGALPALSGRLSLLGTQDWIPNPNNISRIEMESQLRRLFVDTAATAKTGLHPAVEMVGHENVVYGSDCGVPCSNEHTLEENRKDVKEFERANGHQEGLIGKNGWSLFPAAAERASKST
jgi:6-methylsalicylate decarboxylase